MDDPNPFIRLLGWIFGFGRTGRLLSVLYGKVAAVFVFITVVEAFLFAFWHFKRVRNFKRGWRQRLTPDHLSWITKSSIIMCMIEPVGVAILIFVCGICVAATWPLWVLVVSVASTYDLIHYGIRKVKKWRGKLPPESFGGSFNKVKDFPWKFGDYDGDVISRISADAVSNRTRNGNVMDASKRRHKTKKNR